MSNVIPAVSATGAAVLLLAHSLTLGLTLLRRLSINFPTSNPKAEAFLRASLAAGLGLSIDIVALFALSIVQAYQPLWIVVVALILSAATFPDIRAAFSMLKSMGLAGRVGLAALFLLMVLLVLHPPGVWDDTMYHLPVTRAYAEHGGIFTLPFIRFPLFPQNIELLMGLGWMAGGDIGAQLFAQLPLYVMLVSLSALSLYYTGSAIIGVLAAPILILTAIKGTLGFSYIDSGTGAFCWLACLALVLEVEAKPANGFPTWPLVAGIMGGIAIGSKYFALPCIAVLWFWLLIYRRDWRAAVAFGSAALIIGGGWYLRNTIIAGNPVHPVASGFFGYYLWSKEDITAQFQDLARYGVPVISLNFPGALSSAGLALLLPGFAAWFMQDLPPGLKLMRMSFSLYTLVWFFTAQIDRYFAPAGAAAAFLTVWVLFTALDVRALANAIWTRLPTALKEVTPTLVTSTTLIAFCVYAFSGLAISDAAWNARSEAINGHALFSSADKLKPEYGKTLLQFGFENAVYFFDGTVIGDWFGPGRYDKMRACDEQKTHCTLIDPPRMKSLMACFGARMLAVRSPDGPASIDEKAYLQAFQLLDKTQDGLLFGLADQSAICPSAD